MYIIETPSEIKRTCSSVSLTYNLQDVFYVKKKQRKIKARKKRNYGMK